MYLLYETEYDATVKGEQKKLLRWVREAAKLNPDVDLETIIDNASRYVDSSTYKIKTRPTREEYKAQLALTASQKAPVGVTNSQQESHLPPRAETVTEPTAAPAEDIAEIPIPPVEDIYEDYAPPLEMQHQEVPAHEVGLPEPIQYYDTIATLKPEEPEIPVEPDVFTPYVAEEVQHVELDVANPAIDFAPVVAPEVHEEKIDPAVEEYANSTLPARIAVTAEAEKADKIRENLTAIYGDPEAIQNL